MKPVLIIGGGGHSKVLIEALSLQQIAILGVTDPSSILHGTTLLGVPIIGTDDVIATYQTEVINLVNGIGSVKRPERRTVVFNEYKLHGYSFLTVIHPSAVIASDAEIGEGAQVMAGVVIQPGCRIGCNSILNTRATVDHDCRIGDHVHLAPGVTLSGNVTIGNGTHIGTGTTIIQGVSVGKDCLIAAGSLVIRDIPDGVTVMGVPAKAVKL